MHMHISSFHMRLTPELLLPLVLLPAILASSSSMVSTSENYQNFSLPSHCRRRCGNISVPYPFGIDRGCSRPGFNLTCVFQNHHDVPAQIYLGDGVFEVTEINVGYSVVRAKLPVYTMDPGVDSMSFPLSDALPSRWPYAIYTSGSVFVHGCNVVASIVDLANNSAVIDYCFTFCLEFDSSQSVGSCEIRIFQMWDPSFVVQLTRMKRTDKLPFRNSTSIKAFVSGEDGSTDDLILQVVTSNIAHVEVWLSWYMGDYASCDVASKDPNKTYACLSEFSHCNELDTYNGGSAGYWCSGNDSYDGNPYQRNGCSLVPIPSPLANCSRKCGTVDIPFPFGLDSSCYRGERFALVCNTTHNPPILSSINSGYQINKILVEEGKLAVTATSTYLHYYWFRPFTFLEGQFLLSWAIEEQICAAANKSPNFACVAANSVCLDNTNSSEGAAAGYHCKCKDGYGGNPYLEGGCKDIDECNIVDQISTNATRPASARLYQNNIKDC